MEHESLAKLKAAFEDWRSKKGDLRARVPADLLSRARAAARRHGPMAVHRATKVDRGRLKTGRRTSRGGTRAPALRVPAFSRVELVAPAPSRPFAEVEMPTGLKVRLFTPTDAALELLSSIFGPAGAR
jgi:hypothetical protein